MMSFQLFIKNPVHSEGGTIRMPLIPVFASAEMLTGWINSMMGIAGGALTVPFTTSHGTPALDTIGTASASSIPKAFASPTSSIFNDLDDPGRPDWEFTCVVYMLALIGNNATSTVSARVRTRLAHCLDQKLPQRLFVIFFAVFLDRLTWTSVG